MMGSPVTVVLVGIGGYGEVYLSALLDEPRGRDCTIVGAVDPSPETCARNGELEAMGVPFFSSLEEFYRANDADLAVLSSPIQLHAGHACMALENGSHVLVEKPAAATTGDVDRMIRARDKASRFVGVGFQWSFADSVLGLKRDILAGHLGLPLWGRSLTLWPRTEAYYGRNDWAGRKQDPEGRWILDSPASNAMAHHLHNLLFLLGPELDRSAQPEVVDASLVRLNEIETFDTVAAKVSVPGGTELLFLASHTVSEAEAADPRFTLAFQEATLTYAGGLSPMIVRFRDGGTREYPSPDATSQVEKLFLCAEASRRWLGPEGFRERSVGKTADGSASEEHRAEEPLHPSILIPCGLETARPHVAFVEMLERDGPAPVAFPPEVTRISETDGGRLHWVEGLAASMERSFATGEMPVWPGALS